jgi:predicted 2-oxoglutarate/Fe(II)-dependent dioxygenase YbiX
MCNELIEFYMENKNFSFQYRDTFPLSLLENSNEIIKNIILNIKSKAEKNWNISLIVDNPQIVRWPIGSFMSKHFDPKEDYCAALVYLNDKYSGGCTVFSNFTVKPKTGKLVIFPNSLLEHWVSRVEDADRFTLAVWFVRE